MNANFLMRVVVDCLAWQDFSELLICLEYSWLWKLVSELRQKRSYLDGRIAEIGDNVKFWGSSPTMISGKVVDILIPNSDYAISWGQPDGGVFVESKLAGLVLWVSLDEDIELMSRTKE